MAIGFVWMLFHVILLLGVAKLIKAPFFFVAVGSKANIGGYFGTRCRGFLRAAPRRAAGRLGYALGTYGAILCAQMMAAVG